MAKKQKRAAKFRAGFVVSWRFAVGLKATAFDAAVEEVHAVHGRVVREWMKKTVDGVVSVRPVYVRSIQDEETMGDGFCVVDKPTVMLPTGAPSLLDVGRNA
jgi:hypothetical protein